FVVIAAAKRCAIASKMFGSRDDMSGRADITSLQSFDLGDRHHGTEIGILSGPFDHPTPTGIACDIEVGTEGPMNACSPRFLRSYGLHPFDQGGIPGCRQPY